MRMSSGFSQNISSFLHFIGMCMPPLLFSVTVLVESSSSREEPGRNLILCFRDNDNLRAETVDIPT